MPLLIQFSIQHIFLADDDQDDCLLFKEALEELSLPVELTIVNNGEQLMEALNKDAPLPDILFLDLNMPRKNGFECLSEIKQSEKLKGLPVVILSTSFNQNIINQLYTQGAQHYIRKPNEFSKLSAIIHRALTSTTQALTISNAGTFTQPSKEYFLIAT